ncbi:MAG: hypothetical protein ABL927_03100 [Bdellovibrionales bacterium]
MSLFFVNSNIAYALPDTFDKLSSNISHKVHIFKHDKVENFKILTRQHKSRVEMGMVLIFRHFKSEFFNEAQYLSVDMVREYAELHDLPKLMTLSQLKKWGYLLDEDIATIFSQAEGMKESEMGPVLRQKFQIAKSECNRIEALIKEEVFFKKYRATFFDAPIFQVILKILFDIERSVDWTDTKFNRREELNIKNSVLLPEDEAIEYLKAENSSERSIRMSRYLSTIFRKGQNGYCLLLLSKS